ncbi:hypothetical protein TVAG_190110 [Trichomonas vaginalis G3]|uniref:Uncharacterized protein n=1 Tax=Trichomonas vaginalis (strain ATCC PRA-98 / G3) TaxID=412133 RepID=A2DKE0_TRIV3|nr:hypothetical protein TVAGG3_0996360 [Trichomonas vaginalis G3]EAY19117.1 hypothetical protein TVAG_190110 [Trichomonas vaginalis G3]KAI5490415.1 hypothetical protein TVAGG3_0996360 [Trichomonas vaginalis G3]|eukprot:XP_001580103.1 hypothetical protein [Trichomonas vaginalis G3]
MNSSSRRINPIFKVLAILILIYALYILPCFFPSIRSHCCCHTKKHPTQPKQNPSKNTQEKQNITTRYNDDSGTVEKLYQTVKSLDLLELIKQKNAIDEKLTKLTNDLSKIQVPEQQKTEEIQRKSEEEIIKEILKETKYEYDNELPLVLTSIFTPTHKYGKSQFNLIKENSAHRYNQGIEQKDGRWCVNDEQANFSFWTPYPLWGLYFSVSFDKAGQEGNAKSIFFELLLDDKIVLRTEPIQVNGNILEKELHEPTRFNRLRVIASNDNDSKVCIGNVSAKTVKKPIIDAQNSDL